MSFTISPTKTAYTDNGNKYQKTSICSNAGTIAGACVSLGSYKKVANMPLNTFKSSKLAEQICKAGYDLKKLKNTGDLMKCFINKQPKKSFFRKRPNNVISKIVENKIGRIGILSFILGQSAISVILTGKRAGSIIDSQINRFSQMNADKI